MTSESQVAVQMHIVSNLPHAVTLSDCSLVPQVRPATTEAHAYRVYRVYVYPLPSGSMYECHKLTMH